VNVIAMNIGYYVSGTLIPEVFQKSNQLLWDVIHTLDQPPEGASAVSEKCFTPEGLQKNKLQTCPPEPSEAKEKEKKEETKETKISISYPEERFITEEMLADDLRLPSVLDVSESDAKVCGSKALWRHGSEWLRANLADNYLLHIGITLAREKEEKRKIWSRSHILFIGKQSERDKLLSHGLDIRYWTVPEVLDQNSIPFLYLQQAMYEKS
jgi:hypothetical protein